jgi:hypothetical protein
LLRLIGLSYACAMPYEVLLIDGAQHGVRINGTAPGSDRHVDASKTGARRGSVTTASPPGEAADFGSMSGSSALAHSTGALRMILHFPLACGGVAQVHGTYARASSPFK